MEGTAGPVEVGRSYTRGRRHPWVINRWPGGRRGRIPFGPYAGLQIAVFVTTAMLLALTWRHWAVFGGLPNLAIGLGLPIALTFAARHTRIEGRSPLAAAEGLATYLTQPRAGRLGAAPWRAPGASRLPACGFLIAPAPALAADTVADAVVVAAADAADAAPAGAGAAPAPAPRPGPAVAPVPVPAPPAVPLPATAAAAPAGPPAAPAVPAGSGPAEQPAAADTPAPPERLAPVTNLQALLQLAHHTATATPTPPPAAADPARRRSA